MKIYTAYGTLHLIEAYVIETFEARPMNICHPVIRNKEVLLPSHEDILSLRIVLVGEVWLLRLLCQWTPSGKSGPMLHVRFVGRPPVWMFRLESVFRADDLALEEGGQGRVVFSQACGRVRDPGCWYREGPTLDTEEAAEI